MMNKEIYETPSAELIYVSTAEDILYVSTSSGSDDGGSSDWEDWTNNY